MNDMLCVSAKGGKSMMLNYFGMLSIVKCVFFREFVLIDDF